MPPKNTPDKNHRSAVDIGATPVGIPLVLASELIANPGVQKFLTGTLEQLKDLNSKVPLIDSRDTATNRFFQQYGPLIKAARSSSLLYETRNEIQLGDLIEDHYDNPFQVLNYENIIEGFGRDNYIIRLKLKKPETIDGRTYNYIRAHIKFNRLSAIIEYMFIKDNVPVTTLEMKDRFQRYSRSEKGILNLSGKKDGLETDWNQSVVDRAKRILLEELQKTRVEKESH